VLADCKSTIMSNMWFGLLSFKSAGDTIEQHKHTFDHCTLLSYGEFHIKKFDENGDIELNEIIVAPCLIYIEKNKKHSITANTDNAVACCCHAIYESEQDLFPIDTKKVPIVGGSLKLSLLSNTEI